MTHTRTPTTQQLHNPAPGGTHKQQQLQSQLWQRSYAEPVMHGAVVASRADASQPLAVSSADNQGTRPIDLAHAVAGSDTVMPSTALDMRPLVAAPAVATTAVPPHPQQLPQQLPQQPPQQLAQQLLQQLAQQLPQQLPQELPQQLPYQVAPMPHITWPQPVVRWPYQAVATGQAQAGKWHGEGLHSQARVSAPSHLAYGHSAGSVPLSGGIVDPNREQGTLLLPAEAVPLQPYMPPAGPAPMQGMALSPNRHRGGPLLPAESVPFHGGTYAHTHPLPPPLPLAGSAPLQGPTLGPNRPPIGRPLPAGTAAFQGGMSAPLEPSLPLAGSAPLTRGSLAAAEGSLPAGFAARASGRSWEGVQSDADASALGNAMPPNKR